MGTEHMLISRSRKIAFDLSKGDWTSVFPRDAFVINDSEDSWCIKRTVLVDNIIKMTTETNWSFDSEHNRTQFALNLSKQLVDFSTGEAELRLINSQDYVEYYQSYPVVGDRFNTDPERINDSTLSKWLLTWIGQKKLIQLSEGIFHIGDCNCILCDYELKLADSNTTPMYALTELTKAFKGSLR